MEEESLDEPGFSSCEDDSDCDGNYYGADVGKLNNGDDQEMKKPKLQDSEEGTSSLVRDKPQVIA